MDLNELRRQRGNLVQQARTMLDEAERAGRDLSVEDQPRYDRLMEEVDALRVRIDREERQQQIERELAEPQTTAQRPEPGAQPGTNPAERANPRAASDYRAAYERYLRGGHRNLGAAELRALQMDESTMGGYLVAPMAFVQELIQGVNDQVVMRQIARVLDPLPDAASVGFPTLDTDMDDAEWTSELSAGSEDTVMRVGLRELRPHPLAKYIKVSNELLKRSPAVETLVRERLTYRFAVTAEKAYLTGSGAAKPLGVFTASAQGISTGRDVATGNTATAVTADGLINAKFSLKAQHMTAARWIFHREAVREIRKLKDGSGQFIWQAGLSAGTPDRILDLPYLMSEFAPNTFTTGLYVGIVGNFQYYWIQDAYDLSIQRADEKFIETNQTAFYGRFNGDGMPVLEEAFARVKLA